MEVISNFCHRKSNSVKYAASTVGLADCAIFMLDEEVRAVHANGNI
jgi:hypothetical protein